MSFIVNFTYLLVVAYCNAELELRQTASPLIHARANLTKAEVHYFDDRSFQLQQRLFYVSEV